MTIINDLDWHIGQIVYKDLHVKCYYQFFHGSEWIILIVIIVIANGKKATEFIRCHFVCLIPESLYPNENEINLHILLLFRFFVLSWLRCRAIVQLFFAWAQFYVMGQTHYYYIDWSPLDKFYTSAKTPRNCGKVMIFLI